MKIKIMEEDEVQKVAELEAECFSEPWSINAFKEVLNTPYRIHFIAKQDDKVIGECMLSDIAKEGEITNVAVRDEFRQQGVAIKLLERALQEGQNRQIEAYTLEVRKNNLAAVKLYKKFGFKVEGIRKDFYDHPKEDALIMWKR